MKPNHSVRPADHADIHAINDFLEKRIKIHRHLDWLSPTEWLGHQPYLIMENKGGIEALLICSAETTGVYWIRLFAFQNTRKLDVAFDKLFRFALENILQIEPQQPQIACIANQDWMRAAVVKRGWKEIQQVIQLKRDPALILAHPYALPPGISIRQMKKGDVSQVTVIDQASFEPLWQHSEQTLGRALEQSVYATVCEIDHLAVGYQISTALQNRAHIARLAVLPDYQRRHLGLALVQDAINTFDQPWAAEITVNTQKDNLRSLNLYHQLGFRMTPDSFPIFSYFR